jgi:hypothetical protein
VFLRLRGYLLQLHLRKYCSLGRSNENHSEFQTDENIDLKCNFSPDFQAKLNFHRFVLEVERLRLQQIGFQSRSQETPDFIIVLASVNLFTLSNISQFIFKGFEILVLDGPSLYY